MIGAFFITLIANLVAFVISWLPNATVLPTQFQLAWSWISALIANLFWVLPAGANLLLILNFVMILEGAIFTWGIIKIVINWLRGSGA